jgi:signal transduction histidine kinase/ActR/RegA family two-component response regulator
MQDKQAAGTYDEEYRIVRPDGSIRWIRDRASPVRNLAGDVYRIVGVAEDITTRKKLEGQFHQAQKMEAFGILAGGIAHDFNNILTAIIGYTELSQMLLEENPEKVREHLRAVLQATSRATDLVRQILTFSRQRQPERRPIQLQPVVAESLKLLRSTIPSTIEFDTSLATDAPTVLADATQIHQVLMNLCTNAWHAMKERSGRLQVKLEKSTVDVAYAATQPRLRPGVYARVSVSDTGCGMDQATLQRIFEPFFTTKPPGEGTGLGLAVVHGIMESHEGAVSVYSQPGEGTVFHLYFPAHAGKTTVAAAKKGPVPRGNGERVLFVDDEELLARLGQKTLTALGYEVEVATQPAAALAMVRADPQRFALVVTDHTMPGMTGLYLASQLLQIRPGLPIILMTGYSPLLTSARVEAAGIRQLLLKPTTIQLMGASVHAALSAKPTH